MPREVARGASNHVITPEYRAATAAAVAIGCAPSIAIPLDHSVRAGSVGEAGKKGVWEGKKGKHQVKRKACAIGVALMIAGAASVQWAAKAEPTYESLDELMARWQSLGKELKDLPSEDRSEEGREFMRQIGWDHIYYLCLKDSPGVTPGSEGVLGNLVRGRLHLNQPPVADMAALVADTSVCLECQRMVVLYVARHKETFRAGPEGEVLAKAFLKLADSGATPQGVRHSLEHGAAFLWASDVMMQHIMAHCRSGDPDRVRRGIGMLGESKDERASDSLAAMVGQLAAEGSNREALAIGMQQLAAKLGLEAFKTIRGIFESTSDPVIRRDALRALASTQDPRAYPILLAEYDDRSTGIVDSTHASGNRDKRQFYYELWFMVRKAEPGLIKVLEEGSPEEIDLAIELLDRESRFGLPASRDVLYEGLEEYGAQAGEARRRRVDEILARFRAYPDPRSK